MISFVDLTKIFAPEKMVLNGVNLEIADGDFVFLTGISGSGKTTLLNLLLGMQMPTSGDVVVDGQSLSELKKRHLPYHRRQFGVIFQDYKLIADLTVAENIALPLLITGANKEEIASRVGDLLKLVNLTDRADFFPQQLSGGEAQRVGIARALATAPKIIFADEPTGNLDVRAAMGIVKLLKKINELGTTVIVSTHDPRLLTLVKNGRHIHLCAGSAEECSLMSDVLMAENSLTQKQASLDGYKEILEEVNSGEEIESEEEEIEPQEEIENTSSVGDTLPVEQDRIESQTFSARGSLMSERESSEQMSTANNLSATNNSNKRESSEQDSAPTISSPPTKIVKEKVKAKPKKVDEAMSNDKNEQKKSIVKKEKIKKK